MGFLCLGLQALTSAPQSRQGAVLLLGSGLLLGLARVSSSVFPGVHQASFKEVTPRGPAAP